MDWHSEGVLDCIEIATAAQMEQTSLLAVDRAFLFPDRSFSLAAGAITLTTQYYEHTAASIPANGPHC